MRTVSEPDIETEVCPACGGCFLDKGELDALATGMAGGIEYCSIDTEPHRDAFPTRACPKCADQDMRKINLLRLSEIIFDHCPQCDGFFLDKGETAAMNWELMQLSGTSVGEEFRDTIDDHLVRINRLRDVFVGVGSEFVAVSATPVEYFQVVAYFRAPLSIGLRISREPWRARLSNAFGLFKGQDIEVGDKAFDDAFVVQGREERRVRKLLSRELLAALLAFDASRPRLFSRSLLSRLTRPARASLTVRDDRIEYLEGPYGTSKATPDAEAVVQDLLKLAALFERDTT
jgi:Zn-finger nucleic acid-binding protein